MTTILAVVNDIFFYTKLRDALKPQGYRLERARAQQDVPDKAAALLPAAVIVDMNDPGLNGLKALEAIRADTRFKELPVLAFANHEEVGTWQEAKRLGVTKIVSRNEFSSRTRDLVNEIMSRDCPDGTQSESPTVL
jgi:PleD family two-component response regulator